MPKQKDGCAKPAAGVISAEGNGAATTTTVDSPREVKAMQARVGHPAPDFEATAYFKGEFNNIRLSDYKGKWILVCFYPGDFTFV